MIITLFGIFGGFSTIEAQTIYDLVDPNFQNQSLFTDKIKNVKGSVFLNEDWVEAIILRKEQKFTIVSKYDVLNQVIWIQQDGKDLVLNPSSFDRAILDEVTLVTIEGKIYELLVEGDYTLLIRHEKELKKASTVNDSSYGSSDFNTDEIIHQEVFFLKADSKLIELKNKKSLESVSVISEKVLKEMNTNFKKKEDLIQFTKRLNE